MGRCSIHSEIKTTISFAPLLFQQNLKKNLKEFYILNFMEDYKTIMMALGTIPIAYFTGLLTLQTLSGSTLFRKKIKSESELDKIIEEEAKKRNLNPSKIRGSFFSLPEGSGKLEPEDSYYINLNCPFFRTREVVRHEIDHIASGDCDRGQPTFFYYWFVAEPRATLYSLKK